MADNVASLFRGTAAHSPSMAALARDGVGPIDFCIHADYRYLPTPGMFDELAGRLREIITYSRAAPTRSRPSCARCSNSRRAASRWATVPRN